MKALRVILIIVVVLVAAILIVPLFSPATAEVSAETTIALEPDRICSLRWLPLMNRPAVGSLANPGQHRRGTD